MSSDNTLAAADIAAIRAVSDAFTGHFLSRDFDAVAGLYTEDGVLMPQGGPTVNGRAAIAEMMAGFPPLTRFELAVDEIDGRDDLAYVRGTFVMVMTPEGAPEPVETTGKFLEIRRRQGDGSWPIAVDLFNEDG